MQLSAQSIEILELFGWRRDRPALAAPKDVHLLRSMGYRPTDATIDFIARFGGIDVVLPNATRRVVVAVTRIRPKFVGGLVARVMASLCGSHHFHFHVERAIRSVDRDVVSQYEATVGDSLCPIGELCTHGEVLFVSGDGRMYGAFDGDTLRKIGATAEAGVDQLCRL